MANEKTKPVFNDIEFSIVFKGYFNLADQGFKLEEVLKRHFKGQITLTPNYSESKRSFQLSLGDGKYFANFGDGFVSISFVSNGPNNQADVEKISSLSVKVLNLLSSEYGLVFNAMSINKEIIVTGLSKKMVDSGAVGFFINKYLNNNANDWDLSFNKNYNGDIELRTKNDLLEHYQIYSSTLLRNNERVICFRIRLLTKKKREPSFNSDDALDFATKGVTAFIKVMDGFLKSWSEYTLKLLKQINDRKNDK